MPCIVTVQFTPYVNYMNSHLNDRNYVSAIKLIIFSAIFFITFDNIAFFTNVLKVYPFNLSNLGFLLSLAWVLGSSAVLILTLVGHQRTLKPVIIILLLVSSSVAYFMDQFNTVISTSMIKNIVDTDTAEVLDLLTVKLAFYVIFLGALPACLVYKTPVTFKSGLQHTITLAKLFFTVLLSSLLLIYIFSDFYSSFFRMHKPLRYYSNPAYYIFSTGKYIAGLTQVGPKKIATIGTDAKIPATDTHRELVIFVAGETARAENFSLNGYTRETNPQLKKENVISFSNFWSCGTSTAVSLPCMFSVYGSSEFDIEKGRSSENVLDVLKRAGVNILWLDNNSSSKGVAERVTYQSYKSPGVNPVCDNECRDEGMLANLQSYIDEHNQGDIFIILHQMGNHGPAYYKRYPSRFEKFTPVCKSSQLEECTSEEIINAYDNATLYTDYFLTKVIGLLKLNNQKFETAMLYVSDHGESLGESGVYLHGLPNFMAPDTQRHVPAILWLGSNFDDVDYAVIQQKRTKKYSHDNLFHTLLGFFEIDTTLYDKRMDLLKNYPTPDNS